MSKNGSRHPILESPFLRRLLAGNMTLRTLERRLPQMLSNQKFREELDREMLCSDRTSTMLTLLLLGVEPSDPPTGTEELEHLAQIICECTRKTDRKGWFCDATGVHAGLILVHTPPERTQRIIDNIRERYRERLIMMDRGAEQRVNCDIYSYPPYQNGNGGSPGGRREGESRAERVEAEGVTSAGDGNGHGNGHEAEPGAGKAECREAGRGEALARPYPSITALLADPMPLWKRTLDVTGALVALILLSPLLLLIALAIKLTSPGPVIFKQPRVGYRGRIFPSWKFRSMRADADPAAHKKYLASLINQSKQGIDEREERPMVKLDKVDPRITAVGRLLRMSCLDELPQLVNVLKGEMSLVGPRPCLPYEAENYQRWHFQRLGTLPGITGLWQVKGKNKVTFRKMIRLDILYSRQRSLWLDLSILVQTIPAVLREIREGLPAK